MDSSFGSDWFLLQHFLENSRSRDRIARPQLEDVSWRAVGNRDASHPANRFRHIFTLRSFEIATIRVLSRWKYRLPGEDAGIPSGVRASEGFASLLAEFHSGRPVALRSVIMVSAAT